jgi:large subunit ribosomal protein L15
MIKYDPDHFGAHGFVRHAATKKAKLSVNVGDIEDRLAEFGLKGAVHKTDAGYKVDLAMIGIDKLLGAGRANMPLEVIVAEATESAKSKVEAAGGKVITTVQESQKGE